jgi:ferredoxin-thioredoxin reductase catalytic subunit
MVLQAVASHDLWIWSAYFGVAGSNNDIIVFRQSPLLGEIVYGTRATASFYANDTEYPYGYFLADGIYPEWSTFVKTFRDPVDPKMAHFKKRQESARKDVERLFGVLKQRWNFLRAPCRLWTQEKIRDCMYACCILHNMILEDEGRAICQNYVPNAVEQFMPGSAQ